MGWKLRTQAGVGFVLLVASNVYMWTLFRDPPAAPSPAEPTAIQVAQSPGAMPRTANGEGHNGQGEELGEETVVAERTRRESEPLPPAPDALAELVLLISVDGLRPDVIFPHAPNIHRMHLEGASANNARTVSKSSTLPSHASMVSGVDFRRHGLAFNSYRPERCHIQYPTIFSAAQRSGLSTALFVGKRKLAHLLDPDNQTHFEVGGVFCNKVVKLAAPYIERADPGIVFVHFSDPDGAGHKHGWMSADYLAAVRRADRCVGDVLEALHVRGNAERSLVVLTSDHGGHDHNHGSRLLSDKQIPWILWGGPAQRAVRVQRPIFNTDTAATILHALGRSDPRCPVSC
jgi:arylsulfatase A-like enzyme